MSACRALGFRRAGSIWSGWENKSGRETFRRHQTCGRKVFLGWSPHVSRRSVALGSNQQPAAPIHSAVITSTPRMGRAEIQSEGAQIDALNGCQAVLTMPSSTTCLAETPLHFRAGSLQTDDSEKRNQSASRLDQGIVRNERCDLDQRNSVSLKHSCL